MLIDDVTIQIIAGNGGNGAISFRKEKFIPRGGPDGGNGGFGGSVYLVGVNDINALHQFRYKKIIQAPHGEHGKGKKMYGARGKDVELKIPIGSIVTDTLTGDVWEIRSEEDYYLIARGGRGGKGNFEFRSNENKAPHFAEEGKPGKSRTVNINLQFIADVGIIGLPSAGKSSLLNALTNAHVKVAAYPFTTLEPHLGVADGVVFADIPGLIEGAHTGKGLGIKFLKHIEKTTLLVHCIDCNEEDLVKNYEIIRNELKKYNEVLAEKKELIVLTKTDVLSDSNLIKKKMKELHNISPFIIAVSVHNQKSIQSLFQTIKEQAHKKI